mmetsp:Transcript_55175/g.139856  ORF Transcript_55175/g.139856 Transcript_55175/m.139856 type:complete len:87 (+) Transcript_55175:394-654(+)
MLEPGAREPWPMPKPGVSMVLLGGRLDCGTLAAARDSDIEPPAGIEKAPLPAAEWWCRARLPAGAALATAEDEEAGAIERAGRWEH